MTVVPHAQLSAGQIARARESATSARAFLDRSGYSLGVAMVDHAWFDGSANDVVAALGAYQNPDGGFGRGLEVDFGSPASNAFATRLAMHVLLGLRERPSHDFLGSIQAWLVDNQAADGDWHFSDQTRAGTLAPWFEQWRFPSLNPACCVAGLANRLGIATPGMLDRVARLFDAQASLEEARTGQFYTVLPYVEYLAGVDFPDRDAYIEAVAANISATDHAGGYADPQHFFEHSLGGGPDLARRIEPGRILATADRLLGTQLSDGGWPSPYSEEWRPWITATSVTTLAQLRDGV